MKRLRAARRGRGERTNRWLGWHAAVRLGLGLATWAALSLILLGYDLRPGRLSLSVGERSPVQVRAPRTASYVDRRETDRLRAEAAQRVPPQYTALPFARGDAERRVSQEIDALEEIRRVADSPEEALARASWLSPPAAQWLAAGEGRLEELQPKARAIVGEIMSGVIRQGTGDLAAARESAAALARRREPDRSAAELLAAVVSRSLGPTHALDPEATEAAKAEARERVQQAIRTVEAGQAILFEGERVTREHLDILQALGLTRAEGDRRRLAAIALIAGLVVALLGLQTREWAKQVWDRPRWLLLLALLTVGSLFVVNLLRLALPNAAMLIVPTAALMAAALLGDTLGLALALALSVLIGLMANTGLPGTLLALGSAVTALSFSSQLWPVSRLRVLVAAVAAANLVLVVGVGMLQVQQFASIAREAALAVLLYSPGVAALALGGIYMLQRPFGITTHLTLIELSNSRMPLLKRLQAEAPGTYHHSIMVANLAEVAAEEVGADALLTRVGALYHDIGKLYRPQFFVENQALLGIDNVHDRLSSSLSGLIIISHTKDGVELGRAHKLPPEVVSIIAEHHGDTTMSYFYHQALAGGRPEEVSEDHFRYPGPRPTTREAALVMLADAVHAAAKALAEPTPQRVQQLVREVFRDRIVGGQLERCELTFRQIAAAESVMSRVLTAALCRDRIAYPEPVEGGVGT